MDEMRPEYDFSGAVRGKYYKRYHQSSNVVVLEPDGAIATPDDRQPRPRVRTVWILETGTKAPRLITAHPV